MPLSEAQRASIGQALIDYANRHSPRVRSRSTSHVKKQRPEANTQKAILEYLRAKKIFHWRQNVGAVKTDHGFMTFGVAGQADIICCIDGRMVAIEVKSPIGRLSESQREWGERLERAGGKYIVARSVDDVVAKM